MQAIQDLAPTGEELGFRSIKGRVEFPVPKFCGRQMVEIAF